MTLNDAESPKKSQYYFCEKCNYKTIRKKDFNKHLMTRKHKMMTNDDIKVQKSPTAFICECGKSYKYRQGLFQHRKKCIIISNEEDEIISSPESDNNYKAMFIEMVHQNKELQKTLIQQQEQINEIIPKINNVTNNTTNNINNTNHNNFNLNFFLNEQCKDAVNLIDFIKSLNVELNQLEYTGKNGFTEGITNIFTKAIKNMEITKRPIHCTDLKRETLYIKDNEQWNKDNDNGKMKNAIDMLKQNNIAKISDWVKENPECQNSEHPKSDLLINMIQSHTKDDDKSLKKIIKSIAKNAIIPKTITDTNK